jgi:hypothetical protein
MVAPADTVWRADQWTRVGALFAMVVWLALDVGVTVGGGVAEGVYFLLWVSGAGFSLFLWAKIFRPYVALTSTGLVVQNPILREEVKLDDIFSISVGYSGLLIRTQDGRVVVASAVQKSNWARWLKEKTRADDIAAEITSRIPAREEGSGDAGR